MLSQATREISPAHPEGPSLFKTCIFHVPKNTNLEKPQGIPTALFQGLMGTWDKSGWVRLISSAVKLSSLLLLCKYLKASKNGNSLHTANQQTQYLPIKIIKLALHTRSQYKTVAIE